MVYVMPMKLFNGFAVCSRLIKSRSKPVTEKKKTEFTVKIDPE